MNFSKLTSPKNNDKSRSSEEIKTLIHKYSHGLISDTQMTSWLKDVYHHGLTDDETIAVVDAMINSGETMDFSYLDCFVADKHSTGGVGDKVSLILGPLMAAAGLAIPMITGRSLGHTGGTLDKLESIPGYRTQLSLKEFQKIVENVGVSMIGQTDDICPADKKMYALRDATDTIKSVPLICGSIMSKKIAEGIQGLVMNVTVGNGAFMKMLDEARELGRKLVMVGKHFGLSTDVVYTNMNQPLGHTAGLWNEVTEAVDCLRGIGPNDLMEVVFTLGISLLLKSKTASSHDEAKAIQENLIENGKAFKKLVEMVEAHGGNSSYLEQPKKYEHPQFSSKVVAGSGGFITNMETQIIGQVVNSLTISVRDGKRKLSPTGGIKIEKKLGDPVSADEVLAVCSGNNKDLVNDLSDKLSSAILVSEEPVQPYKLIY